MAAGTAAGGNRHHDRSARTSWEGHLRPSTERKVERASTAVGRAFLAQSGLEAAKHSGDVAVISGAICDVLGLTPAARAEVVEGALLHDIGKTALSQAILDKPGPLTESEWKAMRTHTVVGAELLAGVPELEGVALLVRHSHERWDGGGYPDGLAGEAIPFGSRIIFCADAYDAIRSDRSYRKGLPAADALAEVKRGAGTQFDPQVTEALGEVTRQLRGTNNASPRRVISSSKRLMALMLILTAGVGGTAGAATGLFDDVFGSGEAANTSGSAVPCATVSCFSAAGSAQIGGDGKGKADNDEGALQGDDTAVPGEAAGGSGDGAQGTGSDDLANGINDAVNGVGGAVNGVPGQVQDTVGGVTDTVGGVKDKAGGLLDGQ